MSWIFRPHHTRSATKPDLKTNQVTTPIDPTAFDTSNRDVVESTPTRLLENTAGNVVQTLEHRADDVTVPADKHRLPFLDERCHALPPERPRSRLSVLQRLRVGAAAPRGRDVVYRTGRQHEGRRQRQTVRPDQASGGEGVCGGGDRWRHTATRAFWRS